MRIAIATVQIPFQSGGAFLLAKHLQRALIDQGHPVTQITAPFRFAPDAQLARSMEFWRTEDLTQLNYLEPELVIVLSFPAWGLQHPRKRAWILHQHRAAYELFGATVMSDETRAHIHDFDVKSLSECESVFTISRRVSQRLHQYNCLRSTPLLHPPPDADQFYVSESPALPFVFFPSRIESLKRQSLAVEAMQYVPSNVFLVIAGMGGQYGALQEQVHRLGLDDRVRLVGEISDAEKRAYYANCSAVLFPPFDEDYGYVTLEAMLAAKPVITCTDSGGPLDFVLHEETGLVVGPTPPEIGAAIARLLGSPHLAFELGKAGLQHYRSFDLSWDKVTAALLAPSAAGLPAVAPPGE